MRWFDWVMLIASSIAALTGIAAVFMAYRQKKDSRTYAEKQLEAQNMGNRLTKAALDEARKSPGEKRADDLARRGGFASHAKYLAEHDVQFNEVKLDK